MIIVSEPTIWVVCVDSHSLLRPDLHHHHHHHPGGESVEWVLERSTRFHSGVKEWSEWKRRGGKIRKMEPNLLETFKHEKMHPLFREEKTYSIWRICLTFNAAIEGFGKRQRYFAKEMMHTLQYGRWNKNAFDLKRLVWCKKGGKRKKNYCLCEKWLYSARR